MVSRTIACSSLIPRKKTSAIISGKLNSLAHEHFLSLMVAISFLLVVVAFAFLQASPLASELLQHFLCRCSLTASFLRCRSLRRGCGCVASARKIRWHFEPEPSILVTRRQYNRAHVEFSNHQSQNHLERISLLASACTIIVFLVRPSGHVSKRRWVCHAWGGRNPICSILS